MWHAVRSRKPTDELDDRSSWNWNFEVEAEAPDDNAGYPEVGLEEGDVKANIVKGKDPDYQSGEPEFEDEEPMSRPISSCILSASSSALVRSLPTARTF